MRLAEVMAERPAGDPRGEPRTHLARGAPVVADVDARVFDVAFEVADVVEMTAPSGLEGDEFRLAGLS
jgi:hypothetical protein